MPFLLLHGAEPDYAWERFVAAVGALVERLGVTSVVALQAIPMPVPHTRPVTVTAHATRRQLIEPYPVYWGEMRIPGSVSALLELRLGEAGRRRARGRRARAALPGAGHLPGRLADPARAPGAADRAAPARPRRCARPPRPTAPRSTSRSRVRRRTPPSSRRSSSSTTPSRPPARAPTCSAAPARCPAPRRSARSSSASSPTRTASPPATSRPGSECTPCAPRRSTRDPVTEVQHGPGRHGDGLARRQYLGLGTWSDQTGAVGRQVDHQDVPALRANLRRACVDMSCSRADHPQQARRRTGGGKPVSARRPADENRRGRAAPSSLSLTWSKPSGGRGTGTGVGGVGERGPAGAARGGLRRVGVTLLDRARPGPRLARAGRFVDRRAVCAGLGQLRQLHPLNRRTVGF